MTDKNNNSGRLFLSEDEAFLPAIEALYLEAFPKEEQKPFSFMRTLCREGKMEILALLEEDADGSVRFCGLDINMLVPGTDLALLDYFAISPEARGSGYGSRAIALLKERFRGQRMIFEIEREDESAPNAEQRRRRKRFYLRNGLLETGIFASCFGVEFELLVLSDGRMISYSDYVEALQRTLPEEGMRMAAPRLLLDKGKRPAACGQAAPSPNAVDKGDRILVIIPAYNEAGSIERVAGELIREHPALDYLIVTDGSKDETPQICEREGYHFLRLPINLGLAGCFQAGMKYALRSGYRYAVQFDGDGQHRPEYILPMQKKMKEGYNIVLGSRFLSEKGKGEEAASVPSASCSLASGSGGPKAAHTETLQQNEVRGLRYVGSLLIRGAIRLTTGVRVTDPTCGLRMYDRQMIRRFAEEINYAPEPDTISYLIKNGARVAEVPVRVVERESGQSYLHALPAAGYMLKMLTSILLVQNFRA